MESCFAAANKHKYTFPSYLQLEPTSRCNMKCRNCTRDVLSASGDMEFNDFIKVVGQFPFLKEVKLQGLGEPLLNASLFKMAEHLKKKNITTYIASNATLITEENARYMIKYFDKIEISLDAFGKDKIKEIRGVDCLDSILKGIRLLISANNSNADIAVNFVMEKTNVEDLCPLIGLISDLGVYHINIVNLQNWVSVDSKHADKRQKLSERNLVMDGENAVHLKKAMLLAKTKAVHVDFVLPEEQRGKCFWYKKGVYVSWNGYVTPCCIRPNYEEFNFGNIFNNNIRQIWNSPAYVQFRHELNNGNAPSVCKGCNHA
ncbi:MAG: SPASM domain-containing protein [Candidatus Omnitrophota bacterium]